MNIGLIRLKKKLSVMETEGSNQVFMDLLSLNTDYSENTISEKINELKKDYERVINFLEKKETKYKQGKLL